MTGKQTDCDKQHEIAREISLSLAGRDRGRTFIVTEVCGDGYVMIVEPRKGG